MNDSLTDVQIQVLEEYVEYVKNSTGIITAGILAKRMSYDFDNGKGSSVELLNENLYDLIDEYSLSEREIRKLAKEARTREFEWILVDEDYELNSEDVIYDGYGTVTISDGTRLDFPPDLYKVEREAYNLLQKERLEKNPTNGTEFLD